MTQNTLIADPSLIFQSILSGMVKQVCGGTAVYTTSTAQEALEIITNKTPDLVVLDHHFPDNSGLQLMRSALTVNPKVNVLFCTNLQSPHLVVESIEGGARGYVSKYGLKEQIEHSLEQVSQGQMFLCPKSSRLWEDFKRNERSDVNIRVTLREKQILTLIVAGKTSKEIAGQLFISVRTVDAHRRRLMTKLNARGVADLVRIAINDHYVDEFCLNIR